MKILILNCGSSSIKYKLIEMIGEQTLSYGLMERIGMHDGLLYHHFQKDGELKEKKMVREIPDYNTGVKLIINTLIHSDYGVVSDTSEISAVGHRVVHGGEKFASSVLINSDVRQDIRDCIELAPLHNPHNLRGIKACEMLLSGIPQVAVFDTAFHQTMPKWAYIYGLPYLLYQKYDIRRYGFHGTSHRYVSERVSALIGQPIEELKIITCHLGNGCSIAAIEKGKSVDTSMGFTPLEGLVMGTRCGNIDPTVVFHLIGREGLSLGEVVTLLNKQSGLYGISGVSNDMREILQEIKENNSRASLALEIFCYQIRKYIASYAGVLNGADVIVFTAGIGENVPLVRQKCCEKLAFMGVNIDEEKNDAAIGKESIISRQSSKVKVFCIPTNEELIIARDTKKIVQSLKGE
ncbi:acetate kinase [bacterium]|nr:acetate kinase [bacterium]